MRKRRVLPLFVGCVLMVIFAIETLSQAQSIGPTGRVPDIRSLRIRKDSVEHSKVNWRSVVFKKTVHNRDDGSPTVSADLSLQCNITVPDPCLVVAWCPDPVIEEVTDSRGRVLDVKLEQKSSQSYSWSPREFSSFNVDLDPVLSEEVGGEIKRLKGYCNILMAESLEHIDLPFAPSDEWIRLTPDVEIRVTEALNVESMYHCRIDVRDTIGKLGEEPFDNVIMGVHVGDPLPDRLLLLPTIVAQNNSGFGGGGMGYGGTQGKGVIEGSGIGWADKIRFNFRINPSNRRVPFEITNIPLPFERQVLPKSSPSGTVLPVMKHLQSISSQKQAGAIEAASSKPSSGTSTKIADWFKVRWGSLTYTKTISNRPGSSAGKDRRTSEKLYLSCSAEVLKPDLVVGTCDGPTITQIADGSGRSIDFVGESPGSRATRYEPLCYVPTPEMPSKLGLLEGKTRLALGLPLTSRNRPRMEKELRPAGIRIELDPELMTRGEKEIGCVKGCFHALTVNSFKTIRVPFEQSNDWVRLTDELEIRVVRLWHDGFDYRYEIEERRQNTHRPGKPMDRSQRSRSIGGLRDRLQMGPRRPGMYIDNPLPASIVVDENFINTGGEPRRKPIFRGISLPGSLNRNGASQSAAEAIAYMIGIKPEHQQIPFEFRNIPLPLP